MIKILGPISLSFACSFPRLGKCITYEQIERGQREGRQADWMASRGRRPRIAIQSACLPSRYPLSICSHVFVYLSVFLFKFLYEIHQIICRNKLDFLSKIQIICRKIRLFVEKNRFIVRKNELIVENSDYLSKNQIICRKN